MHQLLALVVLQEREDVGQDADDRLAHLAVDEVLERDRRALLGLDHVEDLVDDVLEQLLLLALALLLARAAGQLLLGLVVPGIRRRR